MPRRVHLACIAGLLSGLATAGAAVAADFPGLGPALKAPLQVTTNWTGLFIGAEGGQGWGTDQLFFPGPLSQTSRFDASGAVAGAVIGYNWQASGSSLVLGVDGRLAWADINGSARCPNALYTCATKIDAIMSGVGRVGFAWGNLLAYAKGGYAWSRGRATGTSVATGAIVEQTAQLGRNGYTLGVGVEYMFAPNWSAKLDYDYYSFDRRTVSASILGGNRVEIIQLPSRDVNVVKGGVNYHFNWVPPPVLVRN